MIHWSLKYLACTLACAATARAQLDASLKVAKEQYLAGEAVMAIVTITNHAAKELVFSSDGRTPWLDFVVKDSRGNPITPRGRAIFGAMKIAPGQTLGREVNLSQNFLLDKPGNFTVSAVVRAPRQNVEGTSTNRAFFNQSTASPYWSQKVGLPGNSGNTREYRIINFSADTKTRIYAQVEDNRTGNLVCTFPLGEVLMMRKPVATVDRSQRMHVMFLGTPSMWVHCVIDTDGRLVNRQIHQRGPQGDPQLLRLKDGTVQVANSIPYDPKTVAEERAKIRKASDRPAGTF